MNDLSAVDLAGSARTADPKADIVAVQSIANEVGTLSVSLADASGAVEDVGSLMSRQVETLADLHAV